MFNLFNAIKRAMENSPAGLYTSPSLGKEPDIKPKPLSTSLTDNILSNESKSINFDFAGRMSEKKPISTVQITHSKPKSKPQEFTHMTQTSSTKLPSVVKLAACRSTGVFDVNGDEYVNSNDVELLNKLGFILDISEYSALEKTGEVLDQYSYVEKIAGVPKAVVKAIDKGEAFSGEFLKDMDYDVPKGYEMKGDLCCPIEKEKTALLEKESAEQPGLWANVHAKKESELEKESALGAGTNIKLIPRQERISLIRAYRKLLERQDPANKKAIRSVMGANKGDSLPNVVNVEGKPSMLHYRAAYNTEALQQPRKERTSLEAHVGPNHGGALSTTVDREQALRRLDLGRVIGTYSTPLESLATNQKNKDIAGIVNNRWPAEREITQTGGENLLKAYRYTWRPSLTAPGDWNPVRVNPTPLSKTAGVPEWLKKAILNNDKPTLSSAGSAGAKARARNIATKKNKAELDYYLNMGEEAVPRIVHPPSAYNVQPPLPGI